MYDKIPILMIKKTTNLSLKISNNLWKIIQSFAFYSKKFCNYFQNSVSLINACIHSSLTVLWILLNYFFPCSCHNLSYKNDCRNLYYRHVPRLYWFKVTNKSRKQWRDQDKITVCEILSTQVTNRSTGQ